MILLVAALAAAQVGTASVGQDAIHISGVDQQRTIPCDGRPVFVDGVDNTLTFTGACASLSVAGSDNTIVIGLKPGAPVKVQGTGQTVRWRSDAAPKTTVIGVDNKVVRQP